MIFIRIKRILKHIMQDIWMKIMIIIRLELVNVIWISYSTTALHEERMTATTWLPQLMNDFPEVGHEDYACGI